MTASGDRGGAFWLLGGLAGGLAVPMLRFGLSMPLTWSLAAGAGLLAAGAALDLAAGLAQGRKLARPEIPLFGRESAERVEALLRKAERAQTELAKGAAAINDRRIRNRFENLAQTVATTIGSIARNPNRIGRAETLLSRDVPELARLAGEFAAVDAASVDPAKLERLVEALRRIDTDVADLARGAVGIGEDELASSIARARELAAATREAG